MGRFRWLFLSDGSRPFQITSGASDHNLGEVLFPQFRDATGPKHQCAFSGLMSRARDHRPRCHQSGSELPVDRGAWWRAPYDTAFSPHPTSDSMFGWVLDGAATITSPTLGVAAVGAQNADALDAFGAAVISDIEVRFPLPESWGDLKLARWVEHLGDSPNAWLRLKRTGLG